MPVATLEEFRAQKDEFFAHDPSSPLTPEQRGEFHGLPRTGTSALWRRTGKPLYLFVTRRLLRIRDGEERRPSSGPWPEWVEALGPRESDPL